MTSVPSFDFAIIGAGIVGSAVAMTMAQAGARVIVVEAESKVAAHQTGNNSGVIHSGLYYKPGSKKAAFCVQGREMLYQFCRQYDIPHERCGKLVVATNESEIPLLKELESRGKANGLQNLSWLSSNEILQREPYIRGVAALHVPQTGIVDFEKVTQKYCRILADNGGQMLLHHRVRRVAMKNGDWHIHAGKQTVIARNIINCAGLHSDRVAKMCGQRPRIKIIPFRGEYHTFIAETGYINGLVYPVPDPAFPFLGVHFTRMINGQVEAGPNAVLALKRNGYTKCAFSLVDAIDSLTYCGLWKLGRKHWKTGIGEIWRSMYKPAFVSALRKLMPTIEGNMLTSGGAGVRAQALSRNGELLDDFHIENDNHAIHLLNAPSPAATSSLAIAQTIAQLASQSFK